MAKFTDYVVDVEVRDIAEKLQAKYPMFEQHDLSKVLFYRIKNKDSKEICKTNFIGFPADSLSPYIYFVLTYDKKWSLLSPEQKIVVVFKQLLSMEQDGFDPNSNKYGKIKKTDVNEYSEVLCAVGLRYDWDEVGVEIPNLLDDTEEVEQKNETIES